MCVQGVDPKIPEHGVSGGSVQEEAVQGAASLCAMGGDSSAVGSEGTAGGGVLEQELQR